MMGPRQIEQAALFYAFSLERHIPADHLLRSIDRFVELGELRRELARFYSSIGRPSIDPELMMRMLIIGYCFGIRSERRLCEEVHLNLAYRWFCRLGLDGGVPDHSTFSKNRHGRFRESDLLRRVFETVLRRCIREGLVGGEAFAVDASLIKADANRQKGIEGEKALPPQAAGRAVQERSIDRFDLYPSRLLGDSAYGSGEMLGWLVDEHGIAPHVSVFDKSVRNDGTFSREEFTYEHQRNMSSCTCGSPVITTGTPVGA